MHLHSATICTWHPSPICTGYMLSTVTARFSNRQVDRQPLTTLVHNTPITLKVAQIVYCRRFIVRPFTTTACTCSLLHMCPQAPQVCMLCLIVAATHVSSRTTRTSFWPLSLSSLLHALSSPSPLVHCQTSQTHD